MSDSIEKQSAVRAEGRAKGLVMVNIEKIQSIISTAGSEIPAPPETPDFQGSPDAMWLSGRLYELHSGTWVPINYGEADGVRPTTVRGDSYYAGPVQVAWAAEYDAWRASLADVTPATVDVDAASECVVPLVGSRGLERGVWRPGRIKRDDFEHALREMTVPDDWHDAWELALLDVPFRPSFIALQSYGSFTEAGFSGLLYRPEESGSVIVAETSWADFTGRVSSVVAGLPSALPARDGSKVIDAISLFSVGKQYKFRGL